MVRSLIARAAGRATCDTLRLHRPRHHRHVYYYYDDRWTHSLTIPQRRGQVAMVPPRSRKMYRSRCRLSILIVRPSPRTICIYAHGEFALVARCMHFSRDRQTAVCVASVFYRRSHKTLIEDSAHSNRVKHTGHIQRPIVKS